MTATINTAPATDTRLPGTGIVLLATGVGLLLNLVLEGVEAALLPEWRDNLPTNMLAVGVWSLGGLALALGLLRLGRSGSRRTMAAWIAAALALVTALPFFYCAIPASFAGAAFALASGGRGSLTAVRIVAVVAFVAFVAVSIGMFPFSEV